MSISRAKELIGLSILHLWRRVILGKLLAAQLFSKLTAVSAGRSFISVFTRVRRCTVAVRSHKVHSQPSSLLQDSISHLRSVFEVVSFLRGFRPKLCKHAPPPPLTHRYLYSFGAHKYFNLSLTYKRQLKD